jgi:hypothetical protein
LRRTEQLEKDREEILRLELEGTNTRRGRKKSAMMFLVAAVEDALEKKSRIYEQV